MKVLVTFFKPFGGILKNSSEEVAKRLVGVKTKALDVSYKNDFETLKDEFQSGCYDVLIMLGQAKGRSKVSLEARARNYTNTLISDNYGIYPPSVIEEDSDEYLYTNLNLYNLLTDNTEVSNDAGSYLCNWIYYKALLKLTSNALFIHLPLFTGQMDDSVPSMPLEEEVAIVSKVINIIMG